MVIETGPDMVLVGQAANGSEAIVEFRRHLPGVTLMDLRPPGDVPFIFTGGDGDVRTSVQAMKAGAVEFLIMPLERDRLRLAIDSALGRSGAAISEATETRELQSRRSSLSPREREVMALVVSGLLNKQVAAELGISEITVKAHRGQVMRKMKAESLPDLVLMCVRVGLIEFRGVGHRPGRCAAGDASPAARAGG
jgi:FixJ family two-component response regulator